MRCRAEALAGAEATHVHMRARRKKEEGMDVGKRGFMMDGCSGEMMVAIERGWRWPLGGERWCTFRKQR